MLANTHKIKRPNWLAAKPRSFVGLMGLYESNFRRLIRLLPEQPIPFTQAVSQGRDHDLHVRVLERCKYTLTLEMTHWFEANGQAYPDPNLRVRIYYDAEMAEAIYCDHASRYAALAGVPYIDEAAVQTQWPRNLLLNKWLQYCLQQGHGFYGVNRPRWAAVKASELEFK